MNKRRQFIHDMTMMLVAVALIALVMWLVHFWRTPTALASEKCEDRAKIRTIDSQHAYQACRSANALERIADALEGGKQ